jgi:energy-converting hydrogenase A subunit M
MPDTEEIRLEVRTRDGERVAINIPLNTKRKEQYPNTLKQIADLLRVDRRDVVEVLENWTAISSLSTLHSSHARNEVARSPSVGQTLGQITLPNPDPRSPRGG